MMRNRGSDRNGVFLAGNETRQSQLAKTGKCSRLIHEQKDRIEAALARCQMTISDLASELGLSNDTIRNRINEMVIEGRGVRVAGWRVLDTTMVRIWGVGFERDEPKPVRVRVTAIRKRRKAESEHHRALTPAIGPAAVRFRREGMDEWLFRIQELR
ncbi:hypothetical protein [Oxalobacter formigenes]|uniref:hypothetical protein n=1 Tax=Oxalobacter formigenes TaxID=847 RepID=UPI001E4D6A26|nr:hypothetical protein [Oxalobacter formigenes]MCZ4062961.1 hypothetical protein [Oxalobacter formigenes]WAW00847.1 hypothetical protein NB644_07800 [Oxalobacter formigenes]WAW03177.1 hypothetical protein NB642_08580 [Oxalobacter formigenes]WAW06385.1 hypothetical protein NB639_02965 [Oxalobacter formigenes]WAW07229.1 hypothetical protein NB638_06720 [Oxalobacter formigenes]